MRRRTSDRASTDTENFRSLPDIGVVSERWLHAIGVTTVSELRRLGAPEAYSRIAYRFGSAVNRNLLYALAMGLQGRKYNDITSDEKQSLCEAAGIPSPSTRHSTRRLR